MRENPLTNDGTDLQSNNFGVITTDGTFESMISFCAQHTEAGVGLHWKQGFAFSEDKCKWWYLDIDLPIQYVRNKFTISENVINDGGGINTAVAGVGIPVVANMIQAFSQSDWLFGKVNNCCKLSKTGIADMEVKLGRQFVYTDQCMIAGYFGVLVPTSNSPCGQFIFEPVLGHGKHVGVMWGTEGGYEILSNCDDTWHFWLDYGCHAMYLFKHNEIRSFDLKNRPWSRYISVYANQAQAAQADSTGDVNVSKFLSTPGINVFTQCVQVTPGFQTNMTTALVFDHDCGFVGEVGYNLFFRQNECVQLNWTEGPAIKAAIGGGATNPVLDISDTPLLVPLFVPFANYSSSLINQADLDLQSAAHPTITTELLYFNLGYQWDNRCNPIYLGLGASYEFALKNYAVMNRWGIWGKFNVAF